MNRALSASLLCGLLALTSISTASAVEVASDINVERSYNMPKFMLGASLGSADGDTAISVYGGLGILQSMAFEFGYIDFGKTAADAKVTAAYLDLLGKKRLSTMLSLYGKIGLGFWNYKPKAGDNDSGANMTWGFGMDWRLTSSLHVRMGLDYFSMNPNINNVGASVTKDIDVFSIGMNYSF